jgi:hypothetical protein
MKDTVPVGVTPPTLAVKVTEAPTAAGFKLDSKLVVVGLALTTCVSVLEVLEALLASPL